MDWTQAITGIVAAAAAVLGLALAFVGWRQSRRRTTEPPATATVSADRDSAAAAADRGSQAVAGDARDVTSIPGSGNIYAAPGATVTVGGAPEPPAPAASALHQFPQPPGDFTGRQAELDELTKELGDGGVTITGVRGMGGIGKTALALVLAHRLTDRYPDVQLFLDLRGASEQQPLSTADAMAHVVRSFDRRAQVPEDEAGLAALYRSTLHGKRALLLWDNAASREQVEPLIPPSGCVMLVTSRQRFVLPDMLTKDLDTLPPEDARELLLAIAPRIGDHAGAIAELCGYLPLALRLAARALAERPDQPPEEYVGRLADAKTQLGLVDGSLSLSYDLLNGEQQRLWRALAVFPDTFDVAAAGAVWEVEQDSAGDVLGDVLAYSMVEWDRASGRYRLHDLAHVFADAQLAGDERATAPRRHAAHYRSVLHVVNALFLEGGDDLKRGLAVFDLEWRNVHVGWGWAADRAEDDDEAAGVCSGYSEAGPLLRLRQHPRQRIQWLEAALKSARRLKDREAEGTHLRNLGLAYADLGRPRRAIELYQEALAISRETGDRRAEGYAQVNLGLAYADLGEPRRAIEYHELALAISRETGNRRGEGAVLGNLGWPTPTWASRDAPSSSTSRIWSSPEKSATGAARGTSWATWASPTPTWARHDAPSITTTSDWRSPARSATEGATATPSST